MLGMRGFVLYITVPMILIGLLCLAFGIAMPLFQSFERKGKQAVMAEVIAIKDGKVVVRYTDDTGASVEAMSTSSMTPSPYDVGEQVSVYVAAGQPNIVTIDSFAENWGWSIFMIIFGAMFAGIPAAVLGAFWKATGMARDAIETAAMQATPSAPAPTAAPLAPPTAPTDKDKNQGVTWN